MAGVGVDTPVAVVAGSGIDLSPLLTSCDGTLPFRAFPELETPGVTGHQGVFRLGSFEGRRVILQEGRLHLYEGLPVTKVARTVDALASLGARTIVFTNATGGLLAGARPGQLMAVTRVRLWPCRLWPDAPAFIAPPRKPTGCDFEGAYLWVHGPCYETDAEIEAMRILGGAAVGMSLAPELHRCRQLAIPAAAVACITNACTGASVLTHDAVLANARAASSRLVSVLRDTLRTCADAPSEEPRLS